MKPNYFALKNLIKEKWHTNGKASSAKKIELEVSGKYKVVGL